MNTATGQHAFEHTAEQRRAIATREVSVALSAGAGCGKTFVLTERYLANFDPRDPQALQPTELGHLVAITFTERAAREMRDRVRKKCYQRLLAAEPEDAGYWADLLRSLDGARISTIHSFCGSLLRSRAVEAGIDPGFEVLEQAQADTLLSEVIDDELRRLVAQRDRVTLDLAVRFDLNALDEMLRTLVLDGGGELFDAWLQIPPDEQVSRWDAYFRAAVLPALARQVATSAATQEVVKILRAHVPDNAVMQARRAVLLEKLPALENRPLGREALLADLESIQANAKVQGGGSAKAWPNAEAYAAFRDAATELRKTVDKVAAIAEFDIRGAREAATIGGQLLAMADGVRRRYLQGKSELGVLDFNDLLSGARKLLTDPRHREMRARLSSQIHLLLVDEFQDTDPLQVEVVAALCGEELAAGKLFFVGDYKQSIYRFRGADPHVFRRLREQTPEQGRLSLTQNFRSQPAILEFINALFWHDLGDEYEPLRPHRAQVTPRPAVEFLWAPAAEGIKENRDLLRRREADWIARRLRALIDSRQPVVWDPDVAERGQPEARGARPGDIAILFRALSDVELYEEALRSYEIDYYLVGGHAFYAQQEIFDVLNLLRTLSSPSDLISLVGVLRSGFFSLMDETIFWLSQHRAGLAGGLSESVYPAEIPPEQQQRARVAATTIAELRQRKDRLRICELIDEALARTGYDATLLNEFLGERKLANLRKLVEQARGFERGNFLGLSDFIAQLAEFVVRQPDEPLAATHSENTNVVRLMTIHQSKGLEFPIVVVPDVDRPRHSRAPRVHFDAQLGPLVKLSADDEATSCGGYDLWRFLEKSEELDELNRLLYVATTRAADYLILSGGVADLDFSREQGPWMQLLARRFDLTSGRMIGPLPDDEPRPQVAVTTEEPPVTKASSTRRGRLDLEKIVAEVERSKETPVASHRAIDAIGPDRGARRQFSFSRLAGTLHRQQEASEPTESDAPAAIDARGLGTLVHAVLAAIEFGQPVDVGELVQRHALRHLAGGAAEALEAQEMIERFMGSPRARGLASAGQCHAEVEFLLAWPPGSGSGGLVLSGFIDRLYQDSAGDWHVLDFKTNRVSAANLKPQAAAYEMQMLVYALATEQILGSGPKSLTLHFLRTGQEFSFVWNDAARQRAIALVNEGIAASEAEPGETSGG